MFISGFLADGASREKGQKRKSPLKEEAVPSMFSYAPVEKKVRQASMDRASRRTIGQNAIVFRDMYLQFSGRQNNLHV